MTPDDFRRIAREEALRVAREEAQRLVRPLERDLRKHSGQLGAIREEVSPAVKRMMTESEQAFDERSTGFERLVLNSLTLARAETAELRDIFAKSLPPAATAAKGAEAAAVAGAQAMVRTEGKTDAVQVAADRADKNSLASRVAANRTTIILVVGMLVEALWRAYNAIAHAVTP